MNKAANKRLFQSIRSGETDAVMSALQKDPEAIEAIGYSNANCRDKTPLMFSLQCGQFALAEALIEAGSNINAKMPSGPNFSVLEIVAKIGHPLSPFYDQYVDFASILLKKGAIVGAALHIACFVANNKNSRLDMILLLIKHGATFEHQTPSGNTRELIENNKEIFPDELLTLARAGG